VSSLQRTPMVAIRQRNLSLVFFNGKRMMRHYSPHNFFSGKSIIDFSRFGTLRMRMQTTEYEVRTLAIGTSRVIELRVFIHCVTVQRVSTRSRTYQLDFKKCLSSFREYCQSL